MIERWEMSERSSGCLGMDELLSCIALVCVIHYFTPVFLLF